MSIAEGNNDPVRTGRIFITGAAGFIGFHLARLLLEEGYAVHGYDGMTDYYDVSLKRGRHGHLEQYPHYSSTTAMLEDHETLMEAARLFRPDAIVHLAAQAGVRYSLENPRVYIDSNIVGTFNVLEASRELAIPHLLMASTSSIYGANEKMPFAELDKADEQLTIYAATKKANESMAHSYAHLWNIPTTMFRFFTVYGSWGRPDLASFKFVDAILAGKPIDIYNNGDMYRDFTFVGDLVRGIRLLIDTPPERPAGKDDIAPGDSLSHVAPFRIVNIGNSDKVRLLDFVEAIEVNLGVEAVRNYLPMQKGDVPATWADSSLLERLTGFRPNTSIMDGIAEFVAWHRGYYGH
ncbi:UDP-glucuronate 4-epimerase [Sphingopyxis panaciterrae]|uniref:NAD-dependent epimerase/dehydratase family protein n=1 Tax=Sphingopyxis panaciterrae TaxID=363841 RepID=UPI001424878D|nr:NAD-dependent epimerase/dehydratase family protein [Sphingopyxis panaciterrae]NIJ36403.1 UDP-glucuronate 4-epimerase [Sphingopyxis panaciterrae]